MLDVAGEWDAQGRTQSRRLSLMLAFGTGARRGELCALRWSDVTTYDGHPSIYITKSYGQTADGWAMKKTKTEKSRRRIPLWPDLIDELRSAARSSGWVGNQCPGVGYVLGDGDGRSPLDPDKMTERFRFIAKKAGTGNVHLHSMRHAFGSYLILRGVGHCVSLRNARPQQGHYDPGRVCEEQSRGLPQSRGVIADFHPCGTGGGIVMKPVAGTNDRSQQHPPRRRVGRRQPMDRMYTWPVLSDWGDKPAWKSAQAWANLSRYE